MKLRFLLAFFCLIILFVPLKSVETIAYANEEITKENFDNQVANDLNTLISIDLESYFDSIKGKLGINFTLKEFVASIIRGEIIITPEVIVNFIKNSFKIP